MKNVRMPLLFVGHGNPMNAIEDNIYSLMWEKVGRELPTPLVIVCMSAHWLTRGSFVTSSIDPKIIYDFYGFPQELYEVIYPAKGNIKMAETISEVSPQIKLDSAWGLDHGAWSVLKRMFPHADIPILQISVDYSSPLKTQFEIFKNLRKLREQGILFVGSGNLVHNLAHAAMNSKPYEWALEFEEICQTRIEKGDVASLIEYEKLGGASKLAVPTDDHYRPMINALALTYEDENVSFFNKGIDMSSVSMLSFMYGIK